MPKPIKDPLGDRIKTKMEDVYRFSLPKKQITCCRLDGKSFHTLTRKLDRPYDSKFSDYMIHTAIKLCEFIQGAVFCYVQSDEITVILRDDFKPDSEGWFNYNLQKMCSVSAAKATLEFNKISAEEERFNGEAMFDSRFFSVPDEGSVFDVLDWRQKDCIRNSISMLAQANFPHKSLMGLDSKDLIYKLETEKGVNWSAQENRFRYGTAIRKVEREFTVTHRPINIDGVIKGATTFTRGKWEADPNTPIFSQDKTYITNCCRKAND